MSPRSPVHFITHSDRFPDKLWEFLGISVTSEGEKRVAANSSIEIILGFAMLQK